MLTLTQRNIPFHILLISCLSIINSQCQCPIGYMELTNKVVDSASTLNTVCIIQPDYINDCTYYLAAGLRITQQYQIVTGDDLKCTLCVNKNQFFIAKIVSTPNPTRSQFYCIDKALEVPKCLEYFRRQQNNSFSYECSRCQYIAPYLAKNSFYPFTPALICSDQIQNCTGKQTYVTTQLDSLGNVVPVLTGYCIACDYGFRLSSTYSYCIPTVQYCQEYSLAKCTKCVNGLVLINQVCSNPPKNCESVNSISGQCLKCTSGYKLNGTQCILDIVCDQGWYLSYYGQCIYGSVPSCNSYDSYGYCLDCMKGYQFNRLHTQCVKSAQSLQSQCPKNTSTTKYYVLSGKCVGIDINCTENGFTQSGCYECKPKYYLWRTKCYKGF